MIITHDEHFLTVKKEEDLYELIYSDFQETFLSEKAKLQKSLCRAYLLCERNKKTYNIYLPIQKENQRG